MKQRFSFIINSTLLNSSNKTNSSSINKQISIYLLDINIQRYMFVTDKIRGVNLCVGGTRISKNRLLSGQVHYHNIRRRES